MSVRGTDERIARETAAALWGTETLHSLLARNPLGKVMRNLLREQVESRG